MRFWARNKYVSNLDVANMYVYQNVLHDVHRIIDKQLYIDLTKRIPRVRRIRIHWK
jgi:hypothetical protein